jgi:hypothetical protein
MCHCLDYGRIENTAQIELLSPGFDHQPDAPSWAGNNSDGHRSAGQQGVDDRSQNPKEPLHPSHYRPGRFWLGEVSLMTLDRWTVPLRRVGLGSGYA